ncbi:MAG TPA: glycosyltransferase [Bacteroidota bacterium]|jgi:cellulose synthase/poly-beta-1,6-N-acetylglucosamine synthase-like glycosyltransferase|nr:glycosyltransferase [Bacteroidota bacterium]
MIIAADILLLSALGLILFYLATLSVLALFSQPKKDVHACRQRLFAVVIPAHNEEMIIEKTLRSLLAIDYPQDLFDVILLADNCSDNTAEIGRSFAATVYEREDMSLRGKGHALRWCFDRLLSSGKPYDACVVIDADSEVSDNVLHVFNHYLEHGASVVQIADVVKPQPGAWNSEILRLAFTLYNVVRPMGKKVLGCSAGLRGNGMCFSVSTLRNVPWQAYSLTEDFEYGLMLLLQDINVVFAPEATAVNTMPTEAKNSQSQRTRWELGRLPVIKKYVPLLLREAIVRKSFKLFDAVVEIVMPPIVNILIIVLMIIAAHIILLAVGNKEVLLYVWLWGVVLGFGVLHVFAGMIAVKADRSLYKALFYIPQYAVWKILLYLKLVIKGKPREWVRTTREHQSVQTPKSLLDRR